MSRWNLCATAVALALSAMPASGEVIVEIGSGIAVRGSTGNTIEVDVRNTGPGSVTIGGFNFEVAADSDFDSTGAGYGTAPIYTKTTGALLTLTGGITQNGVAYIYVDDGGNVTGGNVPAATCDSNCKIDAAHTGFPINFAAG